VKTRKGDQSSDEFGASMAEFLIIAPILLLFGMGLLQVGLIYHAKTVVNYATFEAARTGAVNNALIDPMKRELGLRLAPIVGGDGTREKATAAMARSLAAVHVPGNTRVRLIHPTREAFDDWGIPSADNGGKLAIPNSHLRHRRATKPDSVSGVTLRDANLLKIEVTHGLDLKVPIINTFISTAMLEIDPENAAFHAQGKFPIKSVATVRMQSDAWDSNAVTLASRRGNTDSETQPDVTPSNVVSPSEVVASTECVGSEYGLAGIVGSALPQSSSLESCDAPDSGLGQPLAADDMLGNGTNAAQSLAVAGC